MVNAGNADKLATFWAALLGTTVSARFDQFVWLKPASPGSPQLAFQEVPDATPGRRRLHLDVHGPDPDSLRAHAEALGAVCLWKDMTSVISTGTSCMILKGTNSALPVTDGGLAVVVRVLCLLPEGGDGHVEQRKTANAVRQALADRLVLLVFPAAHEGQDRDGQRDGEFDA